MSSNNINIIEEIKEYGTFDVWNKLYFKLHSDVLSNIEELDRKCQRNSEITVRMIEESKKNILASEKIRNKIIDFLSNLEITNFGFGKLKKDVILDGARPMLDNMIVISKEMNADIIKNVPSTEGLREFLNKYYFLDVMANKIVKYIQSLGYEAHNFAAYDGDVNYSLAAQKVGLGWIGRHGLLISKKAGPRQRLQVIFTNISNLTIEKTEDYSWIEGFCDKCLRCVKKCPVDAIYSKPKTINNKIKYIDYKKCLGNYSTNNACGICIKVCPFNNTEYEKLKSSFNSSNG